MKGCRMSVNRLPKLHTYSCDCDACRNCEAHTDGESACIGKGLYVVGGTMIRVPTTPPAPLTRPEPRADLGTLYCVGDAWVLLLGGIYVGVLCGLAIAAGMRG